MASTYNRLAVKRLNNQIALEQITEETQRAIEAEIDKIEEENARELEEYRKEFEREQAEEAMVEQKAAALYKEVMDGSCLACLCEHHPSADCPADEDTHRFNESQLEPEDFYHARDLWVEMMGRIP